ncbi:YSIRK-type signal peptide-containing protein [Staphylococcus intermedius]
MYNYTNMVFNILEMRIILMQKNTYQRFSLRKFKIGT